MSCIVTRQDRRGMEAKYHIRLLFAMARAKALMHGPERQFAAIGHRTIENTPRHHSSPAAPTIVVCNIALSNVGPAAEQIRTSPRNFSVRHLPLPLSWMTSTRYPFRCFVK